MYTYAHMTHCFAVRADPISASARAPRGAAPVRASTRAPRGAAAVRASTASSAVCAAA